MDKFRLKIRIIWIIALLGVVFWLLWLKIVPMGEITYVYSSSQASDFISKLSPDDRLGEVKNGAFQIIGNPVYFNLRTPRYFEKAELTIKYKNPNNLPIIEAGILADSVLWRYKTVSLQNLIIDELARTWIAIRAGELMLLQKNLKYESISDFLASLPSSEKIAVYNYDLDFDFEIDDYQPSRNKIKVGGFRGAWQFFTYIKDEELNFEFEFSDLNKNDDPDNISLYLYYDNQVLDSVEIKDEDIEADRSGVMAHFNIANLPEGVYKLELKANNDIVTDVIKTTQQKISFSGKFELTEAGSAPKIFTDSRGIQITTTNPGSLQNVEVIRLYSPNSFLADLMDVNETYKQFKSSKLSGINSINFVKDGIMLAGDGVFALSESALFNPRLKKADENLDLDEIDYIMANYKFPEHLEDWNMATVKFDLGSVYQEDNRYGFMISVPGLRADDEVNDKIEIGEIKLKLKGKSLLEKIKEIIK